MSGIVKFENYCGICLQEKTFKNLEKSLENYSIKNVILNFRSISITYRTKESEKCDHFFHKKCFGKDKRCLFCSSLHDREFYPKAINEKEVNIEREEIKIADLTTIRNQTKKFQKIQNAVLFYFNRHGKDISLLQFSKSMKEKLKKINAFDVHYKLTSFINFKILGFEKEAKKCLENIIFKVATSKNSIAKVISMKLEKEEVFFEQLIHVCSQLKCLEELKDMICKLEKIPGLKNEEGIKEKMEHLLSFF